MYLLVTDVLSCPRCGPQFGLVVLADRLEERRVLEGSLGCPNCRERYPVRAGFTDLRPADGRALPTPPAAAAGPGDAEAAFRIGALLGIEAGPALVLVAGAAAAHADALADMVDDLEVITVDPARADEGERAGVTRIAAGAMLPFHDRSLRGVALGGGAADTLLEEGARVLRPLGRVVLEDAPTDAVARLEKAGLRVLAAEGRSIVATRG